MGIFSDEKPYTAVTNWVEQLCSEQYDEDDYTGVPDLCDVARLQSTGPTEAARAIRKKLKYGNTHRQARALTLLDAMLQNGDKRVKLGIAGDEPLLERLRVLVQDTTTDNHVKRKAVELFGTWSVNYRNEKGMERLAGLRSQLPTKKRVAPQVRPPTPEDEPSSPVRQGSMSTSPISPPKPPRPVQSSPPRQSSGKKSKSKDDSSSAHSRPSFKPINFEKERPLILQTIAASNQNATNLTNALKRLNRETQHPEEDAQIQQLYRQCRKLRKDILIYIQRTESEEWIGTLINANEELVQSLAHYEKALKPMEQDSDSDAWSVSDSEEEEGGRGGVVVTTQKRMSTGGSSGRSAIAEDLAQRLRATSLSQEVPPPKPPRPVAVEEQVPPVKPPRLQDSPVKPPRPRVPPPTAPKPVWNGRSKQSVMKKPVEEEEEDPFGDEHGIDTPKGNKGWLEL